MSTRDRDHGSSKRTWKNQYLAIVAFIFFGLTLSLGQAWAQSDKHFLWSVSDQSGLRMYLMGSIHMAQEKLYPLDPIIEETFNQATELIIEVDTTQINASQLAVKTLSKGLYPGEETIWKHLDPDTTNLLKACLTKSSISEMMASKMRPWLLAMTLGVERLKNLGYDENFGLEIHFIQEAKAKGVVVYDLETPEEQIDALMAFDEINSVMFLKTTLLEFDQVGEQIEAIFTAWKKGDEKGFEDIYFEIFQKNPELTPVMDKLIDERNLKMKERLNLYLKPGQVPFVLVGAAHLVGPNGLLAAFKADGYEVKQL
jgi:uncharacterized protein YbaP (TraB family)